MPKYVSSAEMTDRRFVLFKWGDTAASSKPHGWPSAPKASATTALTRVSILASATARPAPWEMPAAAAPEGQSMKESRQSTSAPAEMAAALSLQTSQSSSG